MENNSLFHETRRGLYSQKGYDSDGNQSHLVISRYPRNLFPNLMEATWIMEKALESAIGINTSGCMSQKSHGHIWPQASILGME